MVARLRLAALGLGCPLLLASCSLLFSAPEAKISDGGSVDADTLDASTPDGRLDGGSVARDWNQGAYLKGMPSAAEDRFGAAPALSADGSTLAVGLPFEDSGFGNSGAVDIYRFNGTTWSFAQRVKASNQGAGDQFGYSVALSADGEFLLVGAPKEDDEDAASLNDHGAAYLFQKSSSSWIERSYVQAQVPQEFANFGEAVAISSDGLRLAVGAPREDVSASNNEGAVYFYDVDLSGTVVASNRVQPLNHADDQLFGISVALDASGSILAAGANLEDSNEAGTGGTGENTNAPNSGAAYVFALGEVGWQQTGYIKASNTNAQDQFGASLALSSLGDRLVVGAPFEDSASSEINGDQSNNSGSAAGAAYVFRNGGAGWTQEAYLKARNAGAGDRFGQAVRINGVGDTIAVGAPHEASIATGVNGNSTDNTAASAGAAYVFRRGGATWMQEAYLKASNTDPSDAFGSSLTIDGLGTGIVIGAPNERSNAVGVGGDQSNNFLFEAGAAYLFSSP